MTAQASDAGKTNFGAISTTHSALLPYITTAYTAPNQPAHNGEKPPHPCPHSAYTSSTSPLWRFSSTVAYRTRCIDPFSSVRESPLQAGGPRQRAVRHTERERERESTTPTHPGKRSGPQSSRARTNSGTSLSGADTTPRAISVRRERGAATHPCSACCRPRSPAPAPRAAPRARTRGTARRPARRTCNSA